jgi:hypothetical protein
MTLSTARYGLIVALLVAVGGCASTPEPIGFISDYSRLEKAGEGRLQYVSTDLKNYDSFIVDPVQMRAHRDPPVLKPDERAMVTNYFHDAFTKMLSSKGYKVVSVSGPQTARVRIALTDVQKSKWYLNLHGAMKLTGVGLGGASMEGEVIDSVTGAQLAAAIKAGRGNQFELDTFKSLDDVKDVIDKWAKEAGKTLDELHGK